LTSDIVRDGLPGNLYFAIAGGRRERDDA
jgi:hypothetical protein